MQIIFNNKRIFHSSEDKHAEEARFFKYPSIFLKASNLLQLAGNVRRIL
jgi:hypothetical protein